MIFDRIGNLVYVLTKDFSKVFNGSQLLFIGSQWYSMELDGSRWYCRLIYGIQWYCRLSAILTSAAPSKTIHHPKEVKTCGHHCSKSWQRRMRTQRSIVKVMVTTTSRPVSIILEEWAMLSPVLLIISNSCQCVSMESLGPFSGWRFKKCWLVGGRISGGCSGGARPTGHFTLYHSTTPPATVLRVFLTENI